MQNISAYLTKTLQLVRLFLQGPSASSIPTHFGQIQQVSLVSPFCVSWGKKHCFNQQQEVLLQSNIQCKLLALRIQGKLNTVMAVNFYRSCHSFFDHSLVQNDVVCNNVFMSIFYPRFTFFRCHPLSWKSVCDSTSRAEPIIVNRPISNFTLRVYKASTLYMQSRSTPLKKLAPSDYICNLISLVTQR